MKTKRTSLKLVAKIAVLCGCGLFNTSVNAQSTLTDTTSLDEVEITSTKSEHLQRNATQKIEVITREQLQHIVSGNRNLAELIQYQPGASASVLSRNDANWGTYGGIGGKYNTWMLNGLPVDGFIDPMGLDPLALERIEMQRGPASVLYSNYLSQDFAGNQSPLAGTINLVLKEKIDETLTSAGASYGSYNTLSGKVYHQNHFGPLSIIAGANYEQSDYFNYGSTGSWLNMIDDPAYKKTRIFVGLTLIPDKDENHKIKVFANNCMHWGDAGRPNRGYNHNYTIVNLGYSYNVTKAMMLMVNAGYRQYTRAWEEDNYSNGADISLASKNGADQTIIPADLSLTIKHGKAHRFTAGIDYQNAIYKTWGEAVNAARTTGNDASSMQAGIYAQEELVFSGLVIRAGARYNYLEHTIRLLSGSEPGSKNESWQKPLWSAGIRYNTKFGLSTFVNAGSSFMTPSLKSAGGTLKPEDAGIAGKNGQLPNASLNPESGLGIDAGVDYRTRSNTAFTLRGFYTLIDDAIVENVVSQNPSQSQSINAGNTVAKGFEFTFRQKVKKYLECFVNYTYTDSRIANNVDPDQDRATVPFVPIHTANAGFQVKVPWQVSISPYVHYATKIYDGTSISGRTSFEGHELLNAMVTKTIAFNDKFSLEIFGDFYNITNKKFDMPWQFRDPGFAATGGFKFVF